MQGDPSGAAAAPRPGTEGRAKPKLAEDASEDLGDAHNYVQSMMDKVSSTNDGRSDINFKPIRKNSEASQAEQDADTYMQKMIANVSPGATAQSFHKPAEQQQ